jgi:hypothetical protein
LIAGDLKSLTFATSSLSFGAAEVCSPCIAAGLTSLRVSQVTFPIILLFPFRKHERSAALRTCNLKVWHRGFSTKVKTEDLHFLALRIAGVTFLSTTWLWCESADFFYKRNAEKPASRRLIAPECTPAMQAIQFFYENFDWKLLREVITGGAGLWYTRNITLYIVRKTEDFARHIGCS